MNLDERCRPIELILSDVDGVLTDGRIAYDNEGLEYKPFNVHDGLGIKLWQQAGYRFGLVTARTSHIVALRAAELGIEIVRQGSGDKLASAREILDELGMDLRQCCYLGDDLPDLRAICQVGLGVTVANGAEEVRQRADLVTARPGGGGAVRETIETILKSQDRWTDLIESYLPV